MGVVVSLVTSLFRAHPALPNAATARTNALRRLRECATLLNSKIEHKRRLVGDVDRDLVEIGLRKQRAGTMSATDSQTMRALYSDRRVLLDARQRLLDVAANVKTQLMLVEDSQAFMSSAEALRDGSREQAEDVEAIESMMREVTRTTRETTSRQRNAEAMQRVVADVRRLDDGALEDELDRLMQDDAFIGQFAAEDLERAREQIALRLPAAPTHEPQPTAAVAAEAVVIASRGDAPLRARAVPVSRTEAMSEMGF